MIRGKTLAKKVAAALYEKLGFEIELIDVRKICDICDYFLLCSAKNNFHLDALRDATLDVMDEGKTPVLGMEGATGSGWVVVDAGALIVHLFLPDLRERYDLRRLWEDAKTVKIAPDKIRTPPKKRRSGKTEKRGNKRKNLKGKK